jgi:hypothetical protein
VHNHHHHRPSMNQDPPNGPEITTQCTSANGPRDLIEDPMEVTAEEILRFCKTADLMPLVDLIDLGVHNLTVEPAEECCVLRTLCEALRRQMEASTCDETGLLEQALWWYAGVDLLRTSQ